MRTRLLLAFAFPGWLVASASLGETASLPAAGPENGGLRLRLVVSRESPGGKETFTTRVDLINTADRPVTLTAEWPYDRDEGDFRDYFEARISIETFPVIAPWEGQTQQSHRTATQPEYELPPKGVLTLQWQAQDRKLKNRVSDPSTVQNPRFPTDGLYSVHAVATLRTSSGKRLLRSNEQLVAFGGSQDLPKYPFGKVWTVDADAHTARVNLGSLHKIAPGDKFLLRTGMQDFWRLEISDVEETESGGRLIPCDALGRDAADAKPPPPKPGTAARLLVEGLSPWS